MRVLSWILVYYYVLLSFSSFGGGPRRRPCAGGAGRLWPTATSKSSISPTSATTSAEGGARQAALSTAVTTSMKTSVSSSSVSASVTEKHDIIPTLAAVFSFCRDAAGLRRNLYALRANKMGALPDSQIVVISKCGREKELYERGKGASQDHAAPGGNAEVIQHNEQQHQVRSVGGRDATTPPPGVAKDSELDEIVIPKHRIITLPNFGRCDHSYVWAMRRLEKLFPKMFLSTSGHQYDGDERQKTVRGLASEDADVAVEGVLGKKNSEARTDIIDGSTIPSAPDSEVGQRLKRPRDSVFFFIKDNLTPFLTKTQGFMLKPVRLVWRQALQPRGFGCVLKPKLPYTWWHDMREMRNWVLTLQYVSTNKVNSNYTEGNFSTGSETVPSEDSVDEEGIMLKHLMEAKEAQERGEGVKMPWMSPTRPISVWWEKALGVSLDAMVHPGTGLEHVSNSGRSKQVAHAGKERKTLFARPVCYGGNFAVRGDRFADSSTRGLTWSKFEESLTRGDNIEEGHFAERSWAAILSAAPSGKEDASSTTSDDPHPKNTLLLHDDQTDPALQEEGKGHPYARGTFHLYDRPTTKTMDATKPGSGTPDSPRGKFNRLTICRADNGKVSDIFSYPGRLCDLGFVCDAKVKRNQTTASH